MTQARLGYAVDTSGLQQAIGATRALGAASVVASTQISGATSAINQMSQTGGRLQIMQQAQAKATEDVTTKLKAYVAQLDLTSQAAMKAAQSVKEIWNAVNATGASYLQAANALQEAVNKQRAALGMAVNGSEILAKAQEKAADTTKSATKSFGAFEASLAGFAGGVGAQVAAQIGQIVFQIASIPIQSARAQDSLAVLQAKLRFAFGDRSIAERTSQDIMALAQETGLNYQSTAQGVSDMAIAGRAMGMSRSQAVGAQRAFAELGLMSGANTQQISGAMWQVQQMMNLGTLRFQDYRYMATNMGALDDVLAAGMQSKGEGESIQMLIAKISAGQISAEKFFEYLTAGMEKMKAKGAELPNTMEREGNRLAAKWEDLMQRMGKALDSSGFVQSIQRATGEAIEGARRAYLRTREEELTDAISFYEKAQKGDLAAGYLSLGRSPDEIERMRKELAAIRYEEMIKRQNDHDAEISINTRRSAAARYGEATSIVRGLTGGIDDQRKQVESDIGKVRRALGDLPVLISAAKTDEERTTLRASVTEFERGVALLEAQLSRIGYAFDRTAKQIAQSRADLEAYGAGGGVSISQQARAIVEQSISEGRAISMEAAVRQAVDQRLLDVQSRARGAETMRAARLSFEGGAIGRGFEEQQEARIQLGLADFTLSTFGDGKAGLTEGALRARAIEEKRLRDEAALEALLQGRRDAFDIGQDNELTRANLGIYDTAQRAANVRRIQRQRQIASAAPGARDALNERFSLEDAERRDQFVMGSTTRIKDLEEQLALEGKIGDARRLQIAQAEKMRELRRAGLAEDKELVESEMNRLRIADELQRRLEKHNETLAAFEDMARIASGTIGDLFQGALEDAFRKGTISAKTAFDIIEGMAMRLASRLLSLATKPLEDFAFNAITNLVNQFIPGASAPSGSSGGSSGGVSGPLAFGGAFAAGALIPFSSGGVLSKPTYFPHSGGAGVAGEAGTEAIVPLKRGPDGKLGIAGTGGGGDVSVVINDMRTTSNSAPVETRETRGPDGMRQIQVFIKDEVKRQMSGGDLDGAMQARFGAQPRIAER